jgi:hypothetical protein
MSLARASDPEELMHTFDIKAALHQLILPFLGFDYLQKWDLIDHLK